METVLAFGGVAAFIAGFIALARHDRRKFNHEKATRTGRKSPIRAERWTQRKQAVVALVSAATVGVVLYALHRRVHLGSVGWFALAVVVGLAVRLPFLLAPAKQPRSEENPQAEAPQSEWTSQL